MHSKIWADSSLSFFLSPPSNKIQRQRLSPPFRKKKEKEKVDAAFCTCCIEQDATTTTTRSAREAGAAAVEYCLATCYCYPGDADAGDHRHIALDRSRSQLPPDDQVLGRDRDRSRCEQNRHEAGRKATGGETEPPLRRSLPVVQGDGSGCRLAAEPYTTDACVHGSSWSRPRRCFDDACICRLPMPCPRRPSPSRTNEPNAGRRRRKKGTG